MTIRGLCAVSVSLPRPIDFISNGFAGQNNRLEALPTTTYSLAYSAIEDLNLLDANFDPHSIAAYVEQLAPGSSKAFISLTAMPRIRGVELRFGRNFTVEPLQRRIAILGYTRGKERRVPCYNCSMQYGIFQKCVVVRGKFSEACTNCYYSNASRNCSFRQFVAPH